MVSAANSSVLLNLKTTSQLIAIFYAFSYMQKTKINKIKSLAQTA